jgi:hypothetical protein
MNSKNKNIRDLHRRINEFKDYQPRSNLMEEENGDVLVDSHYILICGRLLPVIECTQGQ